MDGRTELIHQAVSFALTREAVRLPGGIETTWSIVRHPGAACALPLDGDDVILVRNYRPPVGGWMLEVPGGGIAPGESPLEAARRELREEAGVAAATITLLGALRSVQGFSDFKLHYFLAADLTPAAQALDENERIETVRVPFADMMSMLRRGELEDSQVPVCLFLALLHGALPARQRAILLTLFGDDGA